MTLLLLPEKMTNTKTPSYNRDYINIKKIISDSNRVVNNSFWEGLIDQYNTTIKNPKKKGEKDKEEKDKKNTIELDKRKEVCYCQYY